MITELGGGGSTASCLQMVCAALDILNANSDVYLGWTVWAAGAFDSSYVLSVLDAGGNDVPLTKQCFVAKSFGGSGVGAGEGGNGSGGGGASAGNGAETAGGIGSTITGTPALGEDSAAGTGTSALGGGSAANTGTPALGGPAAGTSVPVQAGGDEEDCPEDL